MVMENMEDHQAAILELDQMSKAAKADNTWVPVDLWREWIETMFQHLIPTQLKESLNVLRVAMLR